jgi:hypothetical protein
MLQFNEIKKVDTTDGVPAKADTAISRDAIKDAGRVHVGGGMMRFDDTKDAGRVHVGGGMMRF